MRIFFLIISFINFSIVTSCDQIKNSNNYSPGSKLDSLNGVYVYFNGSMRNVSGRNTTPDGYNLGLKYQCVEFVKRYYYKHYNHKMPNSWGHAKDFYKQGVSDGKINNDRNLVQFSNSSKTKPKVGDLVVYKGSALNSFGHVSIISLVKSNKIEVIQQNVGTRSREKFRLKHNNNKWYIDNDRIVGWLRMKG
ncbi:CHAP domain-containing protein [Mesoflavibacter profundi]|uniref:CHAP domain-containing protein n=1 Tax=Mesoflavibacter profundi TaxID=2708110 RepID=UPI00168B26A3|nr:CHAP domain-containing protein [Mesoflavibacter profundi]